MLAYSYLSPSIWKDCIQEKKGWNPASIYHSVCAFANDFDDLGGGYVAAMMFCENPSKFFKRTQVEVVFFPEGRLVNPNNLYEAPVITGSVTQIIERTLEYQNRMVVMQSIIKPKNDNHSIKFYTYPYKH